MEGGERGSGWGMGGGDGGGGKWGCKTTKTVSINRDFGRERRDEVESNRGPPAYQPNALPLSQTS